jgi:hypothetical protein
MHYAVHKLAGGAEDSRPELGRRSTASNAGGKLARIQCRYVTVCSVKHAHSGIKNIYCMNAGIKFSLCHMPILYKPPANRIVFPMLQYICILSWTHGTRRKTINSLTSFTRCARTSCRFVQDLDKILAETCNLAQDLARKLNKISCKIFQDSCPRFLSRVTLLTLFVSLYIYVV